MRNLHKGSNFLGNFSVVSIYGTLREVIFANSRNFANFRANSRKSLLAKCPKVSHSRKLILAKKFLKLPDSRKYVNAMHAMLIFP